MSNNITEVYTNTPETQILAENWVNINEESMDEPIFEPRTFELNEADMVYDENSESDSEYDDFESEYEESFNNDNESDIKVEQNKPKNLTPCVLIDKIDGKIQRCKNIESFRTLWQLVGIWQIDSNEVLKANESLENLGVCSYHFNHDQKLHDSKTKKKISIADSIIHRRRCLFCGKLFHFFSRGNGCIKHLTWNLLGKNIQVVCNGQHKCPALEECNPICKPISKDIKSSRYICSECYELKGGHFHIRPGKGKLSTTCIEQKYHNLDIKKNLDIIARWLFYVKDNKNEEYQKKVLRIFLPSYFQFLNENYLYEVNTEIQTNQSNEPNVTSNLSIPILLKLPTFFMVRTLTRLNKIPIYPDEKELEEKDFEKIGKIAGNKLWQSYKQLKDNQINLQSPTSITEYVDAFPKFLKVFFEKMFLQLESKKIIRSNRKNKLQNKPLKQSNPQEMNKIISFLLSVSIGYAFPYFDLWLPVILSSLCRRPKLISSLHALLTKCSVIGYTNRHERRLEKTRMQNVDPAKRLRNGNNVYNLAVIDNIDFKETSFGFGNIYDVTRRTSHATLRMVFQSTLPIIINETPEPIKELNVDSHLFGMTQGMYIMQIKIDSVFEKLLDFQENMNEDVIILAPAGSPNDDNEIFRATQMYKEEFSLNDDEYLGICADEAIFRRLIKSRTRWEKIRPILGQWHTSKEMLGVLLTIFSSYGIFNLAAAIGVRFLDKLQAVVDYRSTRRVLELIWVAVGIAIHIYAKKKNIDIENISTEPINENICIKVWYFYYKYFAIWKSHLIGIRTSNYELQRDSLTAFAPLFPAAEKNNYTTSVAHFLSILKKYPNLEKKLQYCASVNLTRKGHYLAFDEALEVYGVGYVKQNIIGNVINQENLNLQIRATQEEKERIDVLLNEYLDPYNYNRKDRKVDNRIDPLWKLVENLVEIFQINNYTEHDLFKNNPPSQLTREGLEKLSNAYNEGLKRIKEVYCQEVIKIERINTKERCHLEIVKTDVRSISKSQKRKVTEGNNGSSSRSIPIDENPQQLSDKNPVSKHKRIVTTNEEKEILKPLLLKETIPTEEEINNILANLPSTWNIQRIKCYYLNNKKKN
ncbi:hypothetical protein RhiirA5_421879 [Rhizophagus irregularis]|uniref:Uncharacterized protein n=1 Tax=Rhizophagus irregularis TaxID=588596 RepID=A0A2N0PD45_9GLOM|nr:hypothetical protein RhiirA5_421879 [Rhizophagus irregularis]